MGASVSKVLRHHYSRIALACFVFLAAAVLAQFAAVFLVELWAPELILEGWFLTALSFVCMYLVGFPFFLLLLPRRPQQLPETAPIGGFGEMCVCLLMAMGILYPLNFLGQGLTQVLGGILGGSGSNVLEAFLGNLDLWAVALFAVLLAPIMEELAFRKLLMDRMRTIDRPGSILFSALAFGLFHGNLGQFFYAFGVGLLFGSIYARTGRIRYTIILHVVVNAIGSLVPMVLTRDMETLSVESLLQGGVTGLPDLVSMLGLAAYGLVILCCTVAGVVMLCRRFPRLLYRTPADRLAAPGTAFRTQFLTGGFIAFLLAAVLEMVMSLWAN